MFSRLLFFATVVTMAMCSGGALRRVQAQGKGCLELSKDTVYEWNEDTVYLSNNCQDTIIVDSMGLDIDTTRFPTFEMQFYIWESLGGWRRGPGTVHFPTRVPLRVPPEPPIPLSHFGIDLCFACPVSGDAVSALGDTMVAGITFYMRDTSIVLTIIGTQDVKSTSVKKVMRKSDELLGMQGKYMPQSFNILGRMMYGRGAYTSCVMIGFEENMSRNKIIRLWGRSRQAGGR